MTTVIGLVIGLLLLVFIACFALAYAFKHGKGCFSGRRRKLENDPTLYQAYEARRSLQNTGTSTSTVRSLNALFHPLFYDQL